MSEPTPIELAVDRFVDGLLRGEPGDVDTFLEGHPELPAEGRARLLKLARVLGGSPGRPASRALGQGPPPFERLGPYRLIERLGAGGMGIVYLAEDERLGRQVALKVVRPELAASAETTARFEREARAVARLNHEHIVTVFEAGRVGDVAYLAMEYVPGQSLDERFAAARAAHGHVSDEDLLRWIRDIARALAAAHAAGIVHRDVKPSNIRITPEERALLLDFGLALDPDSATLSRTGQVQGTLYYASPEQVSGGRSKVDARTDVWSLGVTLYEGLTGLRPFEGERAEEVLYRIVSREPIHPRELVPDLPRDVETVTLKALEKERERRYPSAAAFADDLTALLEGRPIQARPTGALTKAWKWGRRKPAHATSLALGALVGLGGPLAYAVVQTRHAQELERQRDLADGQRVIAETRTEDLEQSVMFLSSSIGAIQPQSMAAHIVEALEASAREAWAAEPLDEPAIEARLTELRGLLAGVNTTNAAVATLRRDLLVPAIATAREDYAERPKVEGMLLHTLGATCWSLGFIDLALDAQRSAHEVVTANLEPDDEDRVVVGANLGYYLFASGDHAAAAPFLRTAVDDLTRLHGPDDSRVLHARQNLAMLMRAQGDLDECERILRDVYQRRVAVNGAGDPDTLQVLSSLGALLFLREKYDEAVPMVRAAYTQRRQTLGRAHDATLSSANNLAVMLRKIGEAEEAVSVFREAFEAARTSLGDHHRTTTSLRTGVAETLASLGRYAEAEPFLADAVASSTEAQGRDHADTLWRVWRLGELWLDLGRAEEARALCHERGASAREAHGGDAVAAQRLLATEVKALTALRRYAEAWEALAGRRRADTAPELEAAVSAMLDAWNAGDDAGDGAAAATARAEWAQ